MNVKLHYELEFLGGIYFYDSLHLNSYSVSVNMLTQTTNIDNTNVAMERLKCFITTDLANTVFFGPNSRKEAEVFKMLGANITTLPEDPVDQIIGLMLYCKLNAIMQGRMIITDLSITSTIGGGVYFTIDEDDALGPFAQPGWWQDSTTQHDDLPTDPEQSDKVVHVRPSPWIEYGLLWPEERRENASNTVAYPDFGKK